MYYMCYAFIFMRYAEDHDLADVNYGSHHQASQVGALLACMGPAHCFHRSCVVLRLHTEGGIFEEKVPSGGDVLAHPSFFLRGPRLSPALGGPRGFPDNPPASSVTVHLPSGWWGTGLGRAGML